MRDRGRQPLPFRPEDSGFQGDSGGRDLDKRVTKLEATIKSLATKEDVSSQINRLILWLVSSAIAGIGVIVLAMNFMVNLLSKVLTSGG